MSVKSNKHKNYIMPVLKTKIDRFAGKNASKEEKKEFISNSRVISWRSTNNKIDMAFALPLYICNQCNKFRYVGDKYLHCSICSVAYYCSIKCQKLNWRSHKLTCCKEDKLLIKPLHDLISELTKSIDIGLIEDLLLLISIYRGLFAKKLRIRFNAEDIEKCLNNKKFSFFDILPWELGNYQLDPPRADNIIKINFQLKDSDRINRSVVIFFSGDMLSRKFLEKRFKIYYLKFGAVIALIFLFCLFVYSCIKYINKN